MGSANVGLFDTSGHVLMQQFMSVKDVAWRLAVVETTEGKVPQKAAILSRPATDRDKAQ